MNTQLPHLETFALAAEHESFSEAARILGKTQAAVSLRIQALEQVLGVALFHRHGGGVTLTDAGRALHPYCRRIEALYQEATAAVTGTRTQLSGEVLVAASTIPGEILLPAVLPAFLTQYPGVQVRVRIEDSEAVLHLVEQGEYPLGMVGLRKAGSQLSFQPLVHDNLVAVVAPDHRWHRRRSIPFDQLREESLILREPGSGSRQCLERALEKAECSLTELKTAFELGSNEAIKEAVRRGAGVAILSRLAVLHELERGELHALELAGLDCSREIYLVSDPRRVLSGAALALRSHLETHLPALKT
jgi:DNA-binding transcriptional LysR family regulator